MLPFINIHSHQFNENDDNICIVDWYTSAIENKVKLSLFSAGIHPWYIDTLNLEMQLQQLKEVVVKPNCKAIGECGLDKLKGPEMSLQIELFEKQIGLAIQLQKPLIVHCVQAFDVLFAIIKKYQNKATFVIHGFNQNEQIAKQLIKLGAYLSFGNALLNVKNERLKYIFAQTATHQIFIENDDAACQVELIYEAAAGIKKCDVNMMKEIIFANYKTVFTHE